MGLMDKTDLHIAAENENIEEIISIIENRHIAIRQLAQERSFVHYTPTQDGIDKDPSLQARIKAAEDIVIVKKPGLSDNDIIFTLSFANTSDKSIHSVEIHADHVAYQTISKFILPLKNSDKRIEETQETRLLYDTVYEIVTAQAGLCHYGIERMAVDYACEKGRVIASRILINFSKLSRTDIKRLTQKLKQQIALPITILGSKLQGDSKLILEDLEICSKRNEDKDLQTVISDNTLSELGKAKAFIENYLYPKHPARFITRIITLYLTMHNWDLATAIRQGLSTLEDVPLPIYFIEGNPPQESAADKDKIRLCKIPKGVSFTFQVLFYNNKDKV